MQTVETGSPSGGKRRCCSSAGTYQEHILKSRVIWCDLLGRADWRLEGWRRRPGGQVRYWVLRRSMGCRVASASRRRRFSLGRGMHSSAGGIMSVDFQGLPRLARALKGPARRGRPGNHSAPRCRGPARWAADRGWAASVQAAIMEPCRPGGGNRPTPPTHGIADTLVPSCAVGRHPHRGSPSQSCRRSAKVSRL